MDDSYNVQHRIPRRRSASPDEVAQRQMQTRSALPTRTRHTEEDNVSSSYPMKPMVRRFDRAPLTATSTTQHYAIPLTDGTDLHVTERQLADLPKAYKQAATLVTPAPPQRQAVPAPQSQEPQTDDLPRHRRRFHWLFWVGLAICLMIAGSILFTMVAAWWQVTQDDWHYGRPRTFQTDANVGHGTARNPQSHFIALNLNRHIEVIEIPGNDASKSKIYLGPTLIGPGEDLTPVTLSFEDVNHDGRPDLVLHVGDATVLFLNQKDGTFKAVPNQ